MNTDNPPMLLHWSIIIIIIRSHSTTIAPSTIGLAFWSGATESTSWSTMIQISFLLSQTNINKSCTLYHAMHKLRSSLTIIPFILQNQKRKIYHEQWYEGKHGGFGNNKELALRSPESVSVGILCTHSNKPCPHASSMAPLLGDCCDPPLLAYLINQLLNNATVYRNKCEKHTSMFFLYILQMIRFIHFFDNLYTLFLHLRLSLMTSTFYSFPFCC